MKIGWSLVLVAMIGAGTLLLECFQTGLTRLPVSASHGCNTISVSGLNSVNEPAGAAGSSAANPANSATGSLFSGKPFRTFQNVSQFPAGWKGKHISLRRPEEDQQIPQCEHWAVVTTISGPTEAVLLAGQLPGWCTVIVADKKTPENYIELAKLSNSNHAMHFLSVRDQEIWAQEQTKAGDFLRSIPYNHFARKNIGYLYAIRHGAKVIFDFDDDNILMTDSTGETMDPLENKELLSNVVVPIVGTDVLNHHDLMKASIPASWARGFPLSQLQNAETYGKIGYIKDSVPINKLGVMQFCANGDPDIDALHRLTKPLPMNFDTKNSNPIQVPSHAFAPYNAQASLHTYKALWAMVLPHTVPGRVSDIWRGYFAEAIFRSLGISVAFLPPKVRQDRNSHNYLADMQAELDLYFKVDKLIEFLTHWSSNANTVPTLMEELWIQLYERGYIELDDVKLIQNWLAALVESDYQFPPVVRRRVDNVVVMGQFNFANPPDDVVFWVQKWRELFLHVEVRIPYNKDMLEDLKSRGINARMFEQPEIPEELGYYSPVNHMKLALEEWKNVENVDGVLYIHDDAFLNMTYVMGGSSEFPTHEVIASWRDGRFAKDQLYIDANGTITFPAQGPPEDWERWGWHKLAIPPLIEAAKDPRLEPYKLKDGRLPCVYFGQSDFLFIPTSIADDFVMIASVMFEKRVFLETAVPNILQSLKQRTSTNTRSIKLCTTFSRKKKRYEAGFIDHCLNDESEQHGMFHPFKLSKGLMSWGNRFDSIVD